MKTFIKAVQNKSNIFKGYQLLRLGLLFVLVLLMGNPQAQTRLPPCNGNYVGPCHFVGPTKIDGVDTGNRYDGEVRNSDFNGQGTMIYKNGERYVGQWKDGLRDGQGTLFKIDGTVLRGVWRSDEFLQDFGSSPVQAAPPANSTNLPGNQRRLPECVVGFLGLCYFEGSMVKAGQTSFDRYEGEMLNNVPHGEGTYFYQDNTEDKGNRYKGRFVNGVRDGKGSYFWSNGDRYVGDFKNDKFEGQGTKTFVSGTKYVGDWKNNLMEGQGTMIYAAEGDRYEGQWKNSHRHGYGIYSYGDGTKYVGNYQVGKKNGFGTLYNVDGTVYKQGIWRDGNLVQAQNMPTPNPNIAPRPPVATQPNMPSNPPKPKINSPAPVESTFQINRKRCLGMGLVPGTEAYRKCMD